VLRLDQKRRTFKICQEIVGEVASQNEPIGRHSAHHAFDFTTLSNSALPTTPYTAAVAMASAVLGRYPGSSSVA